MVSSWRIEKGGGQLPSFHKLSWPSEKGPHPSSSPQLCTWSGSRGQDRAPTRWDRPRDRCEEKEGPPLEHKANLSRNTDSRTESGLQGHPPLQLPLIVSGKFGGQARKSLWPVRVPWAAKNSVAGGLPAWPCLLFFFLRSHPALQNEPLLQPRWFTERFWSRPVSV